MKAYVNHSHPYHKYLRQSKVRMEHKCQFPIEHLEHQSIEKRGNESDHSAFEGILNQAPKYLVLWYKIQVDFLQSIVPVLAIDNYLRIKRPGFLLQAQNLLCEEIERHLR